MTFIEVNDDCQVNGSFRLQAQSLLDNDRSIFNFSKAIMIKQRSADGKSRFGLGPRPDVVFRFLARIKTLSE